MSQKVLKSWRMGSDLLQAEIDAANSQIALGKFDEAVETLKKEDVSPAKVAEAYTEMATLYESMKKEFDTAITLLKRSLRLIERLPQEQHLEGDMSARIGWLFLLTGKVEKAVDYLESAAERMQECFGPEHFGVGYIYNNLGVAYLEMESPQSAQQMFALAKDILDFSLGRTIWIRSGLVRVLLMHIVQWED